MPPAVGVLTQSTIGGTPMTAEAETILHGGLFTVFSGSGVQLGTNTTQDMVVNAVAWPSSLPLNITNGTSVVISVTYSSPLVAYLRVDGILNTGVAQTMTTAYNLRTQLNGGTVYNANAPNTLVGLQFRLVNSAGVDTVTSFPVKIEVNITCASAQIPSSDTVSYSVVGSELLEVGQVSHVRATAMSMLVTNMAPPIEAGGELVIARTRQGILTASTPAVLMDNIKKLPEQLYWQSGNIYDGGYSWYIPDQIESYEPRPLDTIPPSDNVLVAGGIMSGTEGYVRVICTWIFEFYTPKQLFERNYNLAWSNQHRELYELLLQRPAVSGNPGHGVLIAQALALANQAWTFYKKNEEAIDGMASKGADLLLQAIKSKPSQKQTPKIPPKPKQKKKSGAPPPVPPKPGRKK
jgi:hypothetical protein